MFREEALHFKKHGRYVDAPPGTHDYSDYWHEQYRRVKEGYTVGGVTITGYHYFYLNFCQIKIASEDTGRKRSDFPHFWNGDYNYFWALDIARHGCSEKKYKELNLDIGISNLDGGLDLLVGKARRRGFSYKNAAIPVCAYSVFPESASLICAYDSKYSEETMGMVRNYLSFLDEHTEFVKSRDYLDTRNHVRASYVSYVGGRRVEAGYKSSIRASTFQNNPDAGRGQDPYWVMVEEGGKFPNLIETYNAIKPSTESGNIRTGQIVIYGTSSMDTDGDTKDFIDMFYNPEGYGLLAFDNIWDEDATGNKCSFFFPDYWGKSGYYDEQGNDDVEGAKNYEIDIRETKRKSLSASGLLGHVVERPFSPEEAFLVAFDNDFPTLELKARLNKITEKDAYKKKSTIVELVWGEDGKVTTKIDLKGKLEPIWFYSKDYANPEGAVVIWEPPIPDSPFGYYKICYDPYRQNQATGDSKAAIYVYRGYDDLMNDGDKLVAKYIGRPETYDMADDICLKLAVYYNAEVMIENEVTHPIDYFRHKNMERYLARQPQAAIDASIKHSKVSRVYGMHMSDKLKDTAAKFYKKWLLDTYTFVDGEPIRNLDRIWCPGLLEETIRWNRKGNFDRVSSIFMLMFAIEEDTAALRAAERSQDTIARKLTERYRRIKDAKTNNYAGF